MRVVLSGGGTGGHYFPALAVGRELQRRGHRVFFVGSKGRIEERLNDFPAEERVYLPVAAFSGKGLKGLVAPFTVSAAALKLLKLFKRWRPDRVVVFGGYASMPAGLAAVLSGTPLFLQEQNSVPGRSLRLLSRFAGKAFLGFPDARKSLRCSCVFSGNPVREEVVEAAESKGKMGTRFLKRVGLCPELPTLLIVGGSQGALWLNETALKALPLIRGKFQVIHVTGPGKGRDRAEKLYRERGIPAFVTEFYGKVWELYAAADAAVSRAGALALAELSLFGIPTLLVPFPFATDDHQFKNGAFYAERGAAILRRQEELPPEEFARIVTGLLFDRIERERLRKNFLSLSRPEATELIVGELELNGEN